MNFARRDPVGARTGGCEPGFSSSNTITLILKYSDFLTLNSHDENSPKLSSPFLFNKLIPSSTVWIVLVCNNNAFHAG